MIWHVTPLNDLKEHKDNSSCECNPRVEKVSNGDIIVVHRSYDGRELIEEMLEELKIKKE